jgi:hypothetical protein
MSDSFFLYIFCVPVNICKLPCCSLYTSEFVAHPPYLETCLYERSMGVDFVCSASVCKTQSLSSKPRGKAIAMLSLQHHHVIVPPQRVVAVGGCSSNAKIHSFIL